MIRRGRIRHDGAGESIHFVPRRKRMPKEASTMSLNLAPMVDVVFLLLIFFITTTTFKRAEGLLMSRMPKQGSLASQTPLPITPIVVHLKQTGPGPRDYSLSIDNFVNAPTSFNDLTTFLKQIQGNPGFDDRTPVVIQSKPDVNWGHVVGCWNAAVRAECKQITFGSQ